jgi:predicted transcriptional regulator
MEATVTRINLSISLPPEMVRLVNRAAKAEHRTRSELIREALRDYLGQRIAVVDVSRSERAAISRGRKQIARGEYVTLDELLNGMAGPTRARSR